MYSDRSPRPSWPQPCSLAPVRQLTRDPSRPSLLSRRLLVAALVASAFVSACTDPGKPTAPETVATLSVQGEAQGGGTQHFYFLSPLAPDREPTANFEPRFLPGLSVEVCALELGECVGEPVATFASGGQPASHAVRVDNDDEHFVANWNTSERGVQPGDEYRISVFIRAVLLGYHRVIIIEDGSAEAPSVGVSHIRAGRTVPIRFRVDEGIVGAAVIDAEGGEIVSADGLFGVVVPAGAVIDDVILTAEALQVYPAVPGVIPNTAYRVAPEGLSFADPVALRIRYDKGSIPIGVGEESLGVVKLVDGDWLRLEHTAVDVNDGLVVGHVMGFSSFSVGGVDCSMGNERILWPIGTREPGSIENQPYAEFGTVVEGKYHTGIDLGRIGDPVWVATSGCVVTVQENVRYFEDGTLRVDRDHGYGKTVIIKHILSDGSALYTHYSHLESISPDLEEQCRSNDQTAGTMPARLECVDVPVRVERNTKVGEIGCTGDGEPCRFPPHLHFETKSFRTLGTHFNAIATDRSEFGYTKKHPDLSGYWDPVLWLHDNIKPKDRREELEKVVGVTQAGGDVNMRTGPSTVYSFVGKTKVTDRFTAIREAPGDPTTCSGNGDVGWYQVKTSGTYFGANQEFPTAWICAGHDGAAWVVAYEDPAYYPIDLGGLPGGGQSAANDVNDHGQFVGWSYDGAQGDHLAVMWQDGAIIRLDEGYGLAWRVNNKGLVVGNTFEGAVTWEGGRKTSLGGSSAQGVNEFGHVVGVSRRADGVSHAVLWKDGEMIDLGTLGGEASQAAGINDMGQVVGMAHSVDGNYHAFLWEDGVMIDLGTLGWVSSYAWTINNAGQVVGGAEDAEGNWRAFLWDQETGLTLLEIPGAAESWAVGINDAGQIVGDFRPSSVPPGGFWQAFLWENGAVTVLDPLDGFGGAQAWSINHDGVIAGASRRSEGLRATVWRPDR